MINDNTQVYITGITYNTQSFPDDPHVVFDVVYVKLCEIANLSFGSLYVNRAENRFSNGTVREQMLVFMKNVSYSGNAYLSDSQSSTVRTNIINKMNELTEISYIDVEVRTTREIT